MICGEVPEVLGRASRVLVDLAAGAKGDNWRVQLGCIRRGDQLQPLAGHLQHGLGCGHTVEVGDILAEHGQQGIGGVDLTQVRAFASDIRATAKSSTDHGRQCRIGATGGGHAQSRKLFPGGVVQLVSTIGCEGHAAGNRRQPCLGVVDLDLVRFLRLIHERDIGGNPDSRRHNSGTGLVSCRIIRSGVLRSPLTSFSTVSCSQGVHNLLRAGHSNLRPHAEVPHHGI